MPKVTRINHVAVVVEDMEKSLAFWRDALGLQMTELRDVPRSFRLIPGMAVTAEIKAGERTILSYLLYPILRGLDESIREP